jgi:hypothetical protein
MDHTQDPHNQQVATPDENSGVLLEAKIKIFDPETAEVYVEGRA